MCVIVCIAKNDSDWATSVVYARRLINNGDFCGDGHPFRLSKRNYLYVWENQDITREKLRRGSVAEYIEAGNEFLHVCTTKMRRQDVDKIQMDLAFGESAFRGIKDGFPDAIIARTKGIYQESQPPVPNPRICLIAMRYAIIQNGRVSFVTRLGEYVDLKLNCRENLVLSTSPVRLQMRLLEDDDDVGDVAVVKLEAPDLSLRNPTYQAVCEGLILKLKPKIISVDEELVKIADQNGNMIHVPGNVKFDTGNNVGTAISEQLVETLGLRSDERKKVKVSLAGGNSMQCCRVKIKLAIRKHKFVVHALVGAVASNTDLLVGMDIIEQLNDKGYTLGV